MAGHHGEGFLAPYRVLDLTDHRGLLAGRMLGQLGADVVQVEPPGGSPARAVGPFTADPAPDNSLYWSAYASAKRGVTCDLDAEAGQAVFLELVGKADFLFESEAPGALAKRGLGWERLCEANPRLIHVSITPFGCDGPKAAWADSELVLWAAGGALLPARDGERPPLRISAPQAYLHAAADAAGGALLAHFARLQTGRGQHVDISVQVSVAECALSTVLADPIGDPRGRPAPPGSPAPLKAPRSSWDALDGRVEMALGVGAVGGTSTNALFAWMRTEGECDPAFDDWNWLETLAKIQAGEVVQAQLDDARAVIARFFARRRVADLVREALERRILLTQVQTAQTLVESEQFNGRGLFETVLEASGPRVVPHAFAQAPGAFAPLRAAPRIGEHNAEVYGEWLGLAARDLERLAAEGAI